MKASKFKTIKRSVKHVFTPEETAKLNVDFGQSFDSLVSAEADLKSVTTTYKAKVQESESRMTSLRATINAGFEMREKPLVLVMDMKAGQKYFYLETDLVKGALTKNAVPLITEAITDADRQQELIEAEAKFEHQATIELFPSVKNDFGWLKVGRLNDRWFSALNVSVGGKSIVERLDSEQSCSQKRTDQINRAVKVCQGWMEETLGREEAKGFKNALELVKAANAEIEE